jgi:hypothetical protein
VKPQVKSAQVQECVCVCAAFLNHNPYVCRRRLSQPLSICTVRREPIEFQMQQQSEWKIPKLVLEAARGVFHYSIYIKLAPLMAPSHRKLFTIW